MVKITSLTGKEAIWVRAVVLKCLGLKGILRTTERSTTTMLKRRVQSTSRMEEKWVEFRH